MGLDMYLTAEKYVSGYDFSDDKEIYTSVVNAIGAETFADKNSPSAEVKIKAGYWRKANAIHNWFVNTCQDGIDECQTSYVTRQQLEELKEICKEVLLDKDKASSLLPTSSGFFFGGTDYDDWYFNTLKDTVEMITNLLKNVPEDWEFYYRSSW
jgi:hypothetical protein